MEYNFKEAEPKWQQKWEEAGVFHAVDNDDRPKVLAAYMIEHQSTVRAAAKAFGISKSTVHKDVSEKLPKMNPVLYEEVHMLFEKNKSERHLRGGEATRQKYRKNSAD